MQVPLALVTWMSDGKMLEMGRKGRAGWDPWHVLVAGLSVGFLRTGLMQREKSGSEVAARSSSPARQESRCLSCLSQHPVLLGAGTGRRMSNAGDPPRNLERPDPAASGLLIQGCVMKITGSRFP